MLRLFVSVPTRMFRTSEMEKKQQQVPSAPCTLGVADRIEKPSIEPEYRHLANGRRSFSGVLTIVPSLVHVPVPISENDQAHLVCAR